MSDKITGTVVVQQCVGDRSSPNPAITFTPEIGWVLTPNLG
jgi:hypothetical protein